MAYHIFQRSIWCRRSSRGSWQQSCLFNRRSHFSVITWKGRTLVCVLRGWHQIRRGFSPRVEWCVILSWASRPLIIILFLFCYSTSWSEACISLLGYLNQLHNASSQFFASNWLLDLARWNIKIWYQDTFTDLSETGVDARLVFPLSVPPSPFAPVVTLLVSFFVTDFWLRKIVIVNNRIH